MIINIIADVEYKRCLLKKVKFLLIEYDKIRPIVMIDNIIMKLNLLISFHHFEKNLTIYLYLIISFITNSLNLFPLSSKFLN